MLLIFKEKVLIIMLFIVAGNAYAGASIYHGLVTKHVFIGEHTLNEQNLVTAISVNGFTAGVMVNSYSRDSFFAGYLHHFSKEKRVSYHAGAVILTGYKKEDLELGKLVEKTNEDILLTMPVIGVEFKLSDQISLQANNMGLVVLNAGIKINF